MGEGVALIPGAHPRIRSNDTEHSFRQSSDLLYLTGFEHPDALCLLSLERFILFVQPRDPGAETWTGLRPGVEGAVERYGADESYSSGEFEKRLPDLLAGQSRVFHRYGSDLELDRVVLSAVAALGARVRQGVLAPHEFIDPGHILHEMRLYKDAEELRVMRAAAEISRDAHHAVARLCAPGRHEYELEAELFRVFRGRGAAGPAYSSIVGCGENATILHYVENSGPLRDGELVLVDAGVELHGYASDVTRSYPVSGRFSGAAREVYEAVLRAQLASIGSIAPGVTLADLHQVAVRSLSEDLIAMGALEGDVDSVIESESYRRFYMHGTGHFLGLDVHDVGAYKKGGEPRPLEPGMVFTSEPGLYLSAREQGTPQAFRGIGVRIEDDLVITEEGFEILTRDIPKAIDDVEAWMRD